MSEASEQAAPPADEDPADAFARWYEANHERVEAVAKRQLVAPAAWVALALDWAVANDERALGLAPLRPPQTHRPRTDGNPQEVVPDAAG